MPFVTIDRTRIYYRLEGNSNRPLLVLSHSLGVDHGIWDPQMPALLEHFQVLRYDTRGHGASDVPQNEYTIELLGRDVLAIADAIGGGQFAFCGLSLGGMIGQWLGANARGRITALVLANTSPRVADPASFNERRQEILKGGMFAIADGVMQRFFSARTLARGLPFSATVRNTLLATDPWGYAGCCSAIRDMDHREIVRRVDVPVLVISGDLDISTPWTGHGQVLAETIPGARAVHLPTAHLSNLERPAAFNAAVMEFLLSHFAAGLTDAGMKVRRAVLGDEYVDRTIANTSAFTREFQEFITQYAWGTVWSRAGLDVRTRRLLVLAVTAALGRQEEFRLHLRAGLANELDTAELKEALLQLALYAGVPAANTAFRIAAEELAQK